MGADDSFKQDPNHPVDRRTIGDVCQVIDALGGDFRCARLFQSRFKLRSGIT